MDWIYLLLIVSITVLLLAFLYRMALSIRSRFPVTVNCWFCNENTRVPYGNFNCWDCPYCEQYNGFTKDGDYNKEIPAQQVEEINHPVSAEKHSTSTAQSSPRRLCEACNGKQLLKVKQLAGFVPFNEANYDMEIEQYRHHLDHVYKLCHPCELKVAAVLTGESEQLGELINKTLPEASCHTTPNTSITDSQCTSHLLCQLSAPFHVRLLRGTSLLCAVMLLLSTAITTVQHSDLDTQRLRLPGLLESYLSNLYDLCGVTVLLGFVTSTVAIMCFGKESVHVCDGFVTLTWLLSIFFHAKYTEHRLNAQDLFLLQSLTAFLNTTTNVWSIICSRYEKSSKKRFIKKRSNRSFTSESPNSSHVSHRASSSPRPSVGTSALYIQHNMANGSAATRTRDQPECSQLDSLHIGTSGKTHSFAGRPLNNASISQTQFTSNGTTNAAKISRSKPLISPARLRTSNLASPRQNLFADNKPRRRLYERSKWFDDKPASLSEGVPSECGSMFSEPRLRGDEYTDDHTEPGRQLTTNPGFNRRPQRGSNSSESGEDIVDAMNDDALDVPSCMARINSMGLGHTHVNHQPQTHANRYRAPSMTQQLGTGMLIGVAIGVFLIFFLDLNFTSSSSSHTGSQSIVHWTISNSCKAMQTISAFVSQHLSPDSINSSSIAEYLDITWIDNDEA